jgi:hypothetical protein
MNCQFTLQLRAGGNTSLVLVIGSRSFSQALHMFLRAYTERFFLFLL